MAQSDLHDRDHAHTTHTTHSTGRGNALDYLAMLLMIIGGLNWGLVGLLDIDLVATLFGQGTTLSRIVYILVGLAAVYGFVTMTKLGRR
jgi:uncharacterized membrane protein YuzA (DUF378 family)